MRRKSKKIMALPALKQAFQSWLAHDPFSMSAAAAYYAIFSLPGLLIIVITITAIFFDQKSVEDQVLDQIKSILGWEVAQSVDAIIDKAQSKDKDILAMIVGISTLLFGATGLFVHLQHALNQIWEVEVKKSVGILKFLQDRATSFGIVLAVGFLLLISLILTSLLNATSEWIAMHVPEYFLYSFMMLDVGLSFLISTLLFTLIFRVLPDAQVKWKEAFFGGALSASLFTIGEYIINIYFKVAEPQSTFGAAGSIILLMLWISYSCMILLLGGEFTKIYAENMHGRKVKPTAIAKKKSNFTKLVR